MKSIIYFLIAVSFTITSCKTDVKPVEENKSNKTQVTKNSKDGPTFTMVDKSKSSVKIITADTIDVNSIEEIVTNANHNTAIRLKKGKYTLDAHLVYYISNEKKEVINKKEVDTRSIGGQIFVSGMTNFSIIGNSSEILSNNPKAVPLFILKAEQGVIKNLTLGHNLPKNSVSNSMSLYVAKSNKVSFNNCYLGSKSKIGLKLSNSKYLTFTDCHITNTQEKIIEVIQGQSIQFVNSSFYNNNCTRGCIDFLGNENSVEFKNAIVKNNTFVGEKVADIKQIITGPSQNIRFRNSKFQNNKNFAQIGIDDFNLTDCEVQKF